MKKALLLAFCSILFIAPLFAQQPPLLNSYTYTFDAYNLTTCINYTSNDTGVVLVQFQLAKDDVGNIVIDQYFETDADTNYGCFTITTLQPCTNYRVTVNMSNNAAYGPISNPLFLFKSSCSVGLQDVSENIFSFFTSGKAITLTAQNLPAGLTAEVTDINGRLVAVQSVTSSVETISLAGHSSGMYVLQVKENGIAAYTQKFILQ